MEDQSLLAASAAALPTNSPVVANPTVYQPPASPATSPRGIPIPLSPPTTPRNANTHRLWNPSRAIVFASPSPTPAFTPPSARRFTSRTPTSATSSSSAFDTPPSESMSGTIQTPKRRGRPRKSTNWAQILNLTPDGKEKESVPSGFEAFREDISTATESSTPLDDMKTLADALEEVEKEAKAEETVMLEDEPQDDQFEDPGIERVKTPDGIEIIMWKKKPLVYTDETDPFVPSAYQPDAVAVQAAVKAKGYFSLKHYINAEKLSPPVEYAADIDEMERVAKLFENDKVIGFDMEWHWQKTLKPTSNDKDIRYAIFDD
ncbi:hypothetical protein ABW20_dc0102912 [Dactylellina cionopaga]|nr:hypothetical protein ABW20_dc0102912 [Dactylellina cionopaga]